MSDHKEEPNGLEAESLEANNSTNSPSNEEKQPSNRRQFFTGMATVLGGGILLHTTNQLSGEDSATEVRSRILSRIQEDLKRSQNELVFGYDKPDAATPHGRYVKADAGGGPAPAEPANNL